MVKYDDLDIVNRLIAGIKCISPHPPVRLMEVCGTHTTAISHYSFRQLLQGSVEFISGPGCPVCVTHTADIDLMIQYATLPNTVITTFGDMLKVPGSRSTLLKERSNGADIRIVFSPMDAIKMATHEPERMFIFIGIGFETTAPIVAASILEAARMNLRNYFVLSFLKTIPQALRVLFTGTHDIDGLILPGHVSAVTGSSFFSFVPQELDMPAVVTGFTPVEILFGVNSLVTQIKHQKATLINAYPRIVTEQGNTVAMKTIRDVFTPVDSLWRGLGAIPDSGLSIQSDYSRFDARCQFPMQLKKPILDTPCRCGEIITGRLKPLQCPLFGIQCTPSNPAGPCMVSGEGACAAYYRYDRHIGKQGGNLDAGY